MDKKIVELYLEREVKIGIPHLHEPGLFYYTGKIVKLDEKTVLIEIDKGLRRVFYEQIMDIKERKT